VRGAGAGADVGAGVVGGAPLVVAGVVPVAAQALGPGDAPDAAAGVGHEGAVGRRREVVGDEGRGDVGLEGELVEEGGVAVGVEHERAAAGGDADEDLRVGLGDRAAEARELAGRGDEHGEAVDRRGQEERGAAAPREQGLALGEVEREGPLDVVGLELHRDAEVEAVDLEVLGAAGGQLERGVVGPRERVGVVGQDDLDAEGDFTLAGGDREEEGE
jgi:hypothetical protein